MTRLVQSVETWDLSDIGGAWAEAQEPQPLPSLPGYRIEAELGKGAMSHVYRAFDARRELRCALKVGRSSEPNEVRRVVAGALEGGFVGADLDALRGHLEELPWVYEAAVRRRWPDTLEITVQEQLPIARWGEEGFLNHEAAVFRTRAAERWQGLPTLDGPPGSEQRLMDYYQRLRDMLAPLDLAVTTLRQDERGQLEARLAGGLHLRLGSEDFLLRVQRFIDLYRNDLQARGAEVASVDMRYASGAAVTFHEPAQVAAVEADRGQ